MADDERAETVSGRAGGQRQTTRAADTNLDSSRPAAFFPLEHYGIEAAAFAEECRDLEACRWLWVEVLRKARQDVRYLRRFDGRSQLQKHELERLRRIDASPPDRFLADSWFRDVCCFAGIDEAKAREWIEGCAA